MKHVESLARARDGTCCRVAILRHWNMQRSIPDGRHNRPCMYVLTSICLYIKSAPVCCLLPLNVILRVCGVGPVITAPPPMPRARWKCHIYDTPAKRRDGAHTCTTGFTELLSLCGLLSVVACCGQYVAESCKQYVAEVEQVVE